MPTQANSLPFSADCGYQACTASPECGCAEKITKRLSNGHLIRLEKRRGKYDVIRNTVGIASAWQYVEKQVSLERARNTFDLLVIGG